MKQSRILDDVHDQDKFLAKLDVPCQPSLLQIQFHCFVILKSVNNKT